MPRTGRHDIIWQYSGSRVQEILLDEVIFKPKLEISKEVGQRKREKSMLRKGSVCVGGAGGYVQRS